jgi:peptidoglycan hydrolase-like protein with peptidoglycan-binding domain
MTDGWLDPAKYERVPITAATGPGTMYDGYAWKFVCHSTESPPGSIPGIISLFQSKPAYCPHFTIDPMGSNRRVQHIPWTWSACALRGGAGGYQTNRGRAVQMEIVGYAQDSASWPDDALWVIADVIADLMRDGCPINPNKVPDDSSLSGTLATMTAPQRMVWGEWQLFDGITCHVRVPNNDHWDCGRLNTLRVGQLVVENMNGDSRNVTPTPFAPLPPAPVAPQAGYLIIGMTGGIVKALQEQLAELGYTIGEIDGVFGPVTVTAVRAFQQDQGLTVDGVAGPATMAKLTETLGADKPLPAPPDPAQGFPAWPGRFVVLTTPMMTGGDIRTWQQQMADRGWRIGADGFYGLESFGVCKSFQAEKGLTVDGILGPQTWAAAWVSPVT